jgi:hypothetical protein
MTTLHHLLYVLGALATMEWFWFMAAGGLVVWLALWALWAASSRWFRSVVRRLPELSQLWS